MNCLTETMAMQFVRGELRDPAIGEVEAHLDACPTCLLVASGLVRSSAPPMTSSAVDLDLADDGVTIRRGTRLGRYLVENMIGRGAMGVVYSAHDHELGRRVAIKVVRTGGDDRYHFRLSREARALARVTHPHVVTVYDIGAIDRCVFVAMELIDGGSFRRWLDASPRELVDVLTIVTKAGRGLAAAHEAGIVHRDVKPENILVGEDGRVVVADFGLARSLVDASPVLGPPAVALSSEGSTSTATGAVLGTPAYMAPEQRRGALPDARSDQYSFCVVAHEALHGVRPSTERNPSLDRAARRSAVPARLTRVLARGLDPVQRLAIPPCARSSTLSMREIRRSRRRSLVLPLSASAVATVGLIAALGLGWRRHVQAEARACDEAARAAAGVWSPERLATTREAFDRTGLSYAATTFRSVDRTLGIYVRSWSAMREQVCTDRRHHRDESNRLAERQEACLAERLAELDTSSRVLAGADAKIVQNALPFVEALPPVARCADVRALSAPLDPAKVARVFETRGEVARARALTAAGKYKEAATVGEAAARSADGIEDRSLQAEAHYVFGLARGSAGDNRGAEASLLRAAGLADAAADDRLRAHAWIALLAQVGYQQLRYDSVPLFDQEARAALERAGGDDLIDSRRRSNMGLILKTQGKLDEAGDELEGAVRLKRAHLPADSDDLGTTVVNLGSLRREQARYDAALDAFNEALRIYSATRGPDAPVNAVILNDIADVLVRKGDSAAALGYAERAVALGERQLGAAHPSVSALLGTHAEALLALERYADAERDDVRGVAIIEGRFGASSARLVPLLTGLGRAKLGLGDAKGALPILERGYALSRPPFDRADRADAEFALARALRANGRERERALALASEAEAVYRQVHDEVALRRVAEWKSDPTATATPTEAGTFVVDGARARRASRGARR